MQKIEAEGEDKKHPVFGNLYWVESIEEIPLVRGELIQGISHQNHFASEAQSLLALYRRIEGYIPGFIHLPRVLHSEEAINKHFIRVFNSQGEAIQVYVPEVGLAPKEAFKTAEMGTSWEDDIL